MHYFTDFCRGHIEKRRELMKSAPVEFIRNKRNGIVRGVFYERDSVSVKNDPAWRRGINNPHPVRFRQSSVLISLEDLQLPEPQDEKKDQHDNQVAHDQDSF